MQNFKFTVVNWFAYWNLLETSHRISYCNSPQITTQPQEGRQMKCIRRRAYLTHAHCKEVSPSTMSNVILPFPLVYILVRVCVFPFSVFHIPMPCTCTHKLVLEYLVIFGAIKAQKPTDGVSTLRDLQFLSL